MAESTSVMLSSVQWLQIIVLGGVAGMLGQAARVVIGLKKLNDEAASSAPAQFETARIVTSLFIGFTAGAFSALATVAKPNEITTQQIVALAGAGYAGADFIEGLFSKGRLTLGSPATAAAPHAPIATTADEYLG